MMEFFPQHSLLRVKTYCLDHVIFHAQIVSEIFDGV